jgi:crotonobetainyl-CoA:carnitine CoA-transferase CaiB-like acyl-CoA transferase
MMKRLLQDIRVLDFGRFVAAPYCGMLLAIWGRRASGSSGPVAKKTVPRACPAPTVSGIQAKLSKTPGRVVTRAPGVGEHNCEIYQDLLKYDECYLNELKQKGIV